jgi:hypothetical protein
VKALELTVYEKEPGRYGREPLYNSPDGLWAYPASHADGYAQEKRLTDAETAADYWGLRAMLDGGLVNSHDLTIPWSRGCQPIRDSMTPAGKRIREQVDTLLRFAMLPHYDEKEMNA